MIQKNTDHVRLRIVHLLHSFGTGGMEKGIAAVVHTRNWGGLDGNTERPVTVTLVTRKTYILTENAMPGKILQWQIRKASGHAADSGS